MLSTVLFLSTYLSGVIASLTRHPWIAFPLYQVVYLVYPTDRWWSENVPDFRYSYFTVLLMAFAVIRTWTHNRSNTLYNNVPLILTYLLCGLYWMVGFWAIAPELNYEYSMYFLKLVIIISLAYKLIDSESRLRFVLQTYIAGAAYFGFYVYGLGRNSGVRVEGIGTVDSPEANGVALALAPVLSLIFYYVWVTKNWGYKVLYLGAAALVVNALVLINSRASFLAVGVSMMYLVFCFYFSKLRRAGQRGAISVMVIMGVLGLAVIADDYAIERFNTIFFVGQQESTGVETGEGRLAYWQAAVEMAADYPLGLGYQGYNMVHADYFYVHQNTSQYKSVHSSWLQALTEVGYPGFFILCLLVLCCFIYLRRTKAQLMNTAAAEAYFLVVAIEGAFITFLIGMSFMNRFTAEILYWLVLFIACAHNIYFKKALADQAPEPLPSLSLDPIGRRLPLSQ